MASGTRRAAALAAESSTFVTDFGTFGTRGGARWAADVEEGAKREAALDEEVYDARAAHAAEERRALPEGDYYRQFYQDALTAHARAVNPTFGAEPSPRRRRATETDVGVGEVRAVRRSATGDVVKRHRDIHEMLGLAAPTASSY